MPAKFIRCQNCPTWFKTPFSQRKYCQTCQIIRDYEVFPHKYTSKATTCTKCSGQFFPARPNWTICARCRNLAEQPSRYEACHRCAKHYPPAPGLEQTCTECVQDTPIQRDAYIKYLYEARERLIEANPPPPQAYFDWIEAEKAANSEKNAPIGPEIR